MYIFRDDGTYNLRELQEAQLSHTMARVIKDPVRFPGVQYVIVHTAHPDPIDPNPLKPFLRQASAITPGLIATRTGRKPRDNCLGASIALTITLPTTVEPSQHWRSRSMNIELRYCSA